jgi:hypothetical protein
MCTIIIGGATVFTRRGKKGGSTGHGLGLEKKDVWQDNYFDPDGPALRDFSFWATLRS